MTGSILLTLFACVAVLVPLVWWLTAWRVVRVKGDSGVVRRLWGPPRAVHRLRVQWFWSDTYGTRFVPEWLCTRLSAASKREREQARGLSEHPSAIAARAMTETVNRASGGDGRLSLVDREAP